MKRIGWSEVDDLDGEVGGFFVKIGNPISSEFRSNFKA